MTPPPSHPDEDADDLDRPAGARPEDDPDDNGKPEEMSELPSPHWKYAFKRTVKEFTRDGCTDLAAALTYYSVLSVFPAILALISLLGIFGQNGDTLTKMLDGVKQLSPQAVDLLGPIIKEIAASKASGFALVGGLLTALWSASGYIGAFGRAMNQIYDVREGRPFLKLRPLQLGITAVTLLLIALAGVLLIISGPMTDWVSSLIGLDGPVKTAYTLVKWPLIAVIVCLVIALLYYATPNVKQPSFKWFSPGAAVAFGVWVLASAAFGFYVSNFGSYNKTYGSVAGTVVFLLWLWITNLALLFGAELDSEIERSRQLAAGMPAEDQVLLPPRDDKGIKKQERTVEELKAEALDLRREGVREQARKERRGDRG
ncbi:YihY/virulence factor BrkB family protein [Arsenicicoccus dermatophilus]|uniref:YihY/virulence factor BrkB family protein n=1 Tax=Arsenicicoccus dermatophilus TaxID=1076331 RepID=UPI0039174107